MMEGRVSEPEIPDVEAFSRVLAVINGKGGVLKTSIVANVAGCLAVARGSTPGHLTRFAIACRTDAICSSGGGCLSWPRSIPNWSSR